MSKLSFFKDYNYKKHALLCAAVYVPLIAFDLTVSYAIVKKMAAKMEEQGLLDE